jgi:hypothetical protein
MYDIYRRPLSRAEKRHYSPWVEPYDPHYLAFPNEPYLSQQDRQAPARTTRYGNCECIAGKCVVSKCNKDYVSVCDGPYGTNCTCTKLDKKDYGCQNTKNVYCPG